MTTYNIKLKALRGTVQFIQRVQRGLVVPTAADDDLVSLAGEVPDNEKDLMDWEIAIYGALAHEVSSLFSTFPVLILDWDKDATFPDLSQPNYAMLARAGHYVWRSKDKTKTRPRPPHRITDAMLISNANRHIAEASATENIVIIPLMGQHEGRTRFEVALLAVFPTWGAWAWRKYITLGKTGGHLWSKFEQALEQETIPKFIADVTIASYDNDLMTHAINQAASDSYTLIQYLAQDYSKG